MAYFNTLSRDGTGDFDGDGMSDRDEFLAGLDPTNRGAVFTVFIIQSLTAGTTELVWSAVPGKTYTLEFKDNLTETAWQRLSEAVVVNGSVATAMDHSAPAKQRFYRAVLLTE